MLIITSLRNRFDAAVRARVDDIINTRFADLTKVEEGLEEVRDNLRSLERTIEDSELEDLDVRGNQREHEDFEDRISNLENEDIEEVKREAENLKDKVEEQADTIETLTARIAVLEAMRCQHKQGDHQCDLMAPHFGVEHRHPVIDLSQPVAEQPNASA